MSEQSIAQIASGLSKAQRAAILNAEQDGELGNYFIRFPTKEVGKPIHDAGLTTVVWSGLMLNATGLAIRNRLLATTERAADPGTGR